MIKVDIPQIAYKTWNVEYVVWNEDSTRNRILEREFESDLLESLFDCRYSAEHDHVR